MTLVASKKEQKGRLTMDPMVESSWRSKEYSTLTEETVSLVGKFASMLSTTSGGFTPQAAGVGQMKLEAHHDTQAKGTQRYEFG